MAVSLPLATCTSEAGLDLQKVPVSQGVPSLQLLLSLPAGKPPKKENVTGKFGQCIIQTIMKTIQQVSNEYKDSAV